MARKLKSPVPLQTNLAEFVILCEAHVPHVDIPLLLQAFSFAEEAHEGQTRESGAQFLEHSIEVATILAEQGMDTPSIAAGLLHDAVEDTTVTLDSVRAEFGDEIAQLVDGVTKIGGLPEPTPRSLAENYRKMLLATARDVRVIVIKLADRLHNMRTIEHISHERQLRLAEETEEIYAPLAHRFGMARIKWELEDHAFRILRPQEYAKVRDMVRESREEREAYIGRLVGVFDGEFEKHGLKAAVRGRAKHFTSIWRKMNLRGVPFDEIFDLLAFRVIVDTVQDCYVALGIIHACWRPVTERFRDHIATPKPNGYQSLHTTVIVPGKRRAEIQIRTWQMHRTAEYGIAAHWRYKEGRPPSDADTQIAWIRQALSYEDEAAPEEFVADLKGDLFGDEVFVFTPKGDLVTLPRGSTPIDFAFAVHTEVGLSCSGAKINNRLVPLTTEVKTGETVEILTTSGRRPSRDWLSIVRTGRARSKIRAFLRKQEKDTHVSLGREMIERELSRRKLQPPETYEDLAQALGHEEEEGLFAAAGSGDLHVNRVVDRIAGTVLPAKEGVFARFADMARRGTRGVKVGSVGDLLFRFARCCQPVPGDPIVGYVTRGRGVTVHRKDCESLAALVDAEDEERSIEVTWDADPGSSFLVRIDAEVDVKTRHLLSEIAQAAANAEAEVRGAQLVSLRDGPHAFLAIEVSNLKHLQRVLRHVGKVRGVHSVDRARGGEAISAT
jgi:guanosine-3',5'-bis(diphosphate) 3'-pyrophosphohydrolase